MDNTKPNNENKSQIGSIIGELLRLIIIGTLTFILIQHWYHPQVLELLDENKGTKVAVINVAKVIRESKNPDKDIVIRKIKKAQELLSDDGFIVLDSTNIMGQSRINEVSTEEIMSIKL